MSSSSSPRGGSSDGGASRQTIGSAGSDFTLGGDHESFCTQLLSAFLDAVVIADKEANVVDINSSAEAMFEISKSDAIGQPVTIFLQPSERHGHSAYVQKYHETGVKRLLGMPRKVVGWRTASRSTFPVEISLGESAGPDGACLGFIATFRDLTKSSPSMKLPLQMSDSRERIQDERAKPIRDCQVVTFGGKTMPLTFQNTTIVRQGYLLKMGTGLIKKWTSRWMVLTSSAIFVFADAQSFIRGDKPKSFLTTKDCSVAPANGITEREHSFGLFHSKSSKKLVMQALSEDEMLLWIRAIQHHCFGMSLMVGIEDFDLLCVVGKGSFGTVLQVRRKDTKEILAMKILNKKDLIQTGQVDATRREQRVMEVINHPFIVRMHFAFQTPNQLCFVMDFINGGELFRYIQRERVFPEDRARFYASEVLLALEYLHNLNIIYRDLKPENVMLDKDGHICLTDFGLSKDAVALFDRTYSLVGSPFYMAPEILMRRGHDHVADWWSFGVLLHEMLCGLPPFYDTNVKKAYERIMTEEILHQPHLSDNAMSVLHQLLKRDPRQRLGSGRSNAKEVKDHPFFRSVDWDLTLAKGVEPDFVPPVRSQYDVSNFDSTAKPVFDFASPADATHAQKFQDFKPFVRTGRIPSYGHDDFDVIACQQFMQSCNFDLNKALTCMHQVAEDMIAVDRVLANSEAPQPIPARRLLKQLEKLMEKEAETLPAAESTVLKK